MITVKEADQIVESSIKTFPAVDCPLDQAYGAVLREDIKADRDFPPFNKALMDGIAIKYSSWQAGERSFPVKGTQAAGQAALEIKEKNSCVEIMTGAVVPQEYDCVIPVEEVQMTDSTASINGNVVQSMQNIRKQGADYKKGDLLLESGSILLPQQIAIAAAVGKSKVKVTQKPQIAVISTGDEIVEIDKNPQSYQIRQSNAYALEVIFRQTGYLEATRFHIKDDIKQLKETIQDILNGFDVLVLSGGVSMGKFDYVPQVLQELGVTVLFHKVKQRPGKPFWFGRHKEGKPVFALPGNPVSTQIGAYRYALPYLKRAVGLKKEKQQFAVLAEDFRCKTPLTYFLPVTIVYNDQGNVLAQPVTVSGSGDYVALAKADGFIELPGGEQTFPKGEIFKFYPWR